MKYEELDMEQVRKCCRQHVRKTAKGLKYGCESCPLRRERIGKDGKTYNKFCYYVVKKVYEETMDDYNELLTEELQHPEEWEDWTKGLESEE